MLLKVAHHGARVLTLITGLGLMAVLLVPSLTGDASVTLTSMHVRALLLTLDRHIFLSLSLSFSDGPASSSSSSFVLLLLLLPRTRAPTSFSPLRVQPFLMVFAFAVLSSMGVTAYVTDFGGRVR